MRRLSLYLQQVFYNHNFNIKEYKTYSRELNKNIINFQEGIPEPKKLKNIQVIMTCKKCGYHKNYLGFKKM